MKKCPPCFTKEIIKADGSCSANFKYTLNTFIANLKATLLSFTNPIKHLDLRDIRIMQTNEIYK